MEKIKYMSLVNGNFQLREEIVVKSFNETIWLYSNRYKEQTTFLSWNYALFDKNTGILIVYGKTLKEVKENFEKRKEEYNQIRLGRNYYKWMETYNQLKSIKEEN